MTRMTRMTPPVPVEERCDHCEQPADDQPLRTVGDGSRLARLHRRCEVAWVNGGSNG